MKDFLKIDFDKNRVYGLDILRAFAILFVIVGHGSYILPANISKFYSLFVLDGVSIFFVLSGFLIGGILIKIMEKEKCTLKILLNFWIRRWLRTLPNYFLILLVLALLSYLFNDHFNFWNKKMYFLFLQNFNSSHPAFFPEAWSLSVEEWFYLLIPSLLFILIGILHFSPKIAIISTAISILLFVTTYRYYKYSHLLVNDISLWDSIFRKQVITRLDSLMFGLIGAYVSNYFKEFWIKYRNTFFITGILILTVQQLKGVLHISMGSHIYLYLCVYSFTITSLGTLFLLPFLSEFRKGKGFIYSVITYISLISYSMYLLNYSLIQHWALKFMNWFDPNEISVILLRYLFYWFFTIIGAIVLYKYYEVPFMKLRDLNNRK